MRPWRAVVLALVAVYLPLSCARKHAPAPAATLIPDAGKGGSDAGLMLGDTTEVPSGPCGDQSVPAIGNPPNISFIIDHSGSMDEELANSGLSKYESARVALRDVLKAVGHRINYGASVFPGLANVTGCEAGDELMPMGPGDPPSYARAGVSGPRLKDLLGRLSIASVLGGTPTAATLTKALTTLKDLEGTTFVVLITDGAPNCDAELSCTAQGCIPNIEGLTSPDGACSPSLNCCMPTSQSPDANLACLDAQATVDAVQALADAGISTFVVGMPGSEPYAQLLSSMAEAGGTARAGSPKYYPVEDTVALE
ncbi:MAG TPA: hypothetical protein VNG33_07565, partial [Polyangiaceae bacterium]|nr:hypothetical protein [Polyangiaceae bacterium]